MITPNDIATKDFKKVSVGYSPEEVDIFLDDLYEDYEILYNKSLTAKEEPAQTSVQPDQMSTLQKTIERTLALAEAAAEETKQAAKKEGDLIIENAKLQAEGILQDARTKSYELEQQIIALQNRYELMRTRVKLLLYAEIELLDKNEILAELDEERQTTK